MLLGAGLVLLPTLALLAPPESDEALHEVGSVAKLELSPVRGGSLDMDLDTGDSPENEKNISKVGQSVFQC